MNFNDMGFVAIKLYYLIDDFTVQFHFITFDKILSVLSSWLTARWHYEQPYKKSPYWKNTHSSIWLASDTIPLIDTDHCARGHRVWVDFLVPQFFVWRIQTYWALLTAQCPFQIGPRSREDARGPVRHQVQDMVSTHLDMTAAILYPVKPLVVGTPKLKLIVRVEHVIGDTLVRVLAPVLMIHHPLPPALVQKHQIIINPKARVRSPQNHQPEVVKMKVDLTWCLYVVFHLKQWQPTKDLTLKMMSKGTNLMMN